jgi:hypothetical protein
VDPDDKAEPVRHRHHADKKHGYGQDKVEGIEGPECVKNRWQLRPEEVENSPHEAKADAKTQSSFPTASPFRGLSGLVHLLHHQCEPGRDKEGQADNAVHREKGKLYL